MKIGIMQPYFFPYIGYWQLVGAVDIFVVYDNIQFSKGGWIRRNRILYNGKERMITVPLKKDSDYLDINERVVSESFEKERIKILRQIELAYKNAPEYERIYPFIIEKAVNCNVYNLFQFLYECMVIVIDYLEIDTQIVISSSIDMDHFLTAKDRVIGICQALGGTTYINPNGGINLYDKGEFQERGIQLQFIRPGPIIYGQFDHPFVENLSIIDVMMFNSKTAIKDMLKIYWLQ